MFLGGLAVLSYAAYHSVFTVQGGHRAVIFNRFIGVKDTIYPEGMHFMIPWIDYPEIFSIRRRVHKLPTETPSKDLQMIAISIRILYHPSPEDLPNIYRTLGTDYDVRVINSIGPEVLKSTVAQFNSYELVNQREMVSTLIKKRLVERAKNFWIQIDEVAITDLNFGSEYMAAIEAKQVAQQEAERARFIVERAKQFKQEIIVRAQGEAKAAQMFNEQLKNDPEKSFLQLRRIDAAKDIATVIAQSNNRVVLNSDILMFNQLLSRPTRSTDKD